MHLRQEAIGVGLTEQGRNAGGSHAIPGRRTLACVTAGRGNAIAQVAALSQVAIGIDEAIGLRLAEEAVADRPRRAFGVDGALAHVDAAVVEADKAGVAIGLVHALGLGLTHSGQGLAFLAGRAVAVEITSIGSHAEIALADLACAAIVVDETDPGGDALAVYATLAESAVGVDDADRWGDEFTLAVLADFIGAAIGVDLALGNGQTRAPLTEIADVAGDRLAGIAYLTSVIDADFKGATILIGEAIADEIAIAAQTDLCRAAIGVAIAIVADDALAGTAGLIGQAVGVALALGATHALPGHADLA